MSCWFLDILRFFFHCTVDFIIILTADRKTDSMMITAYIYFLLSNQSFCHLGIEEKIVRGKC